MSHNYQLCASLPTHMLFLQPVLRPAERVRPPRPAHGLARGRRRRPRGPVRRRHLVPVNGEAPSPDADTRTALLRSVANEESGGTSKRQSGSASTTAEYLRV